MLGSLLRLIRPRSWIKNFFVLLPVFFAGQIFEPKALTPSLIAFAVFCFLASSVYVFNDILDVKEDRNHPTKRNRPVASGKVTIALAAAVSLLLVIASATLATCLLGPRSLTLLASYFVINLGYSLGLKDVAIVDVFIVSLGFVIRIALGAMVSGVEASPWLIIMTILVTLVFALGKRKDDIAVFLETGMTSRKVVNGYNHAFLDVSLSVLSSIIVVSYIMYTINGTTHLGSGKSLYLTAIVVLFGVIRYLQQILVEKKSADPTELLLTDHVLQVVILVWFVTFGIMVYFL